MDYKDYLSGQRKYNFWTMAKMDLIEVVISRLIRPRITRKPKILNIGVGIGDDLKVMHKHGKNYVIDINEKALQLVPKRYYMEKKVASASSIPYSNETFELAVAFDTLEHIQDDEKAINEIKRVLKNRGKFIFTVPAFQFLYSSHDKALHHERRYNRNMLKKLLGGHFRTYFNFWNFFLFLPIALMRLKKKKSRAEEDIVRFSRTLNNFLFYLIRIENKLIQHRIPLPFGISIIGICVKM